MAFLFGFLKKLGSEIKLIDVGDTAKILNTNWQKVSTKLLKFTGAEKVTLQLEVTVNGSTGIEFRVQGQKGKTATYDKGPSTKLYSDGEALNTTMVEKIPDADYNANLDIWLSGQCKDGYIEAKTTSGTDATVDYANAILKY